MSTRWRIGALFAALVLVELASYWKLAHWLLWTQEPWLAYASGFAFVCLMLAAIVALASPIDPAIRRQLQIGGISLFLVQALANVLMAYQFGLSILPIDVVTSFFNVGSDLALKSMAIVQGSTLSVVSISFWTVLGEMLRSQVEDGQAKRKQFRDIEKLLEEV